MRKESQHSNLRTAKKVKKDEFYTQLTDISKEMKHYKNYFKDKVVYCNCDDPRVSNFFHYFSYNFEKLGLKKLITTCYKNQNPDLFSQNISERAVFIKYKSVKNDHLISYPDFMKSIKQNQLYSNPENNTRIPIPEDIGIGYLEGDGDFRSKECVELLKQADIVVTNPPFSLFREFVAQLDEYNKKFIIIGNINAVTYKETFRLIKENKLWLGASIHSGDREFGVPDDYPLKAAGFKVDDNGKKFIRVKGVRWFINLDISKRHEKLILYKTYNEEEYPKYDNYNAINVDKTKDIPYDYDGYMGVPITFLDKYNPSQFEIIGLDRYVEDNPNYGRRFSVNGRETYERIIIKNKQNMNIELKEITIRELTNGYEDNEENGVVGYGGKLDIRPPYQREFIYKDKQRDAVIDTITKDFPLNVMYWAVREDGNFEVIDGQQRTISIAQFVEGDFPFNQRYFHNLQNDEREQILNYKLMVYLCSGTDSEKLEWFKTINIAGEKLTDQELRNAVYSGSWVSDAKRYFSKNGCAAYGLGGDYLNGSPIRQDFLETAIKWISNDEIEQYMAQNQHEPNGNELWLYFQSVINWVKAVFPKYRREMKGIDWGFLYNGFKDQKFDSARLKEEIAILMEDEDVTKKKGIYSYVLTRKEKHLNIRAFSPKQQRESYERQKGICVVCKEHFEIGEMEADHITPWHEGGKTTAENCQMLCKEDNRRKSGK